MITDWLAVGNLVGGVVQGAAAAADPYFYTEQEKARDSNAAAATAAQVTASTAQLAAVQAREATTQKAITYGLAGVLGVSFIYLASRVVG